MIPGTEDDSSHSSDEMEAEAEPEVASRFGPSRFLPSGECQAVREARLAEADVMFGFLPNVTLF